jgi:acyl-CoA thioester hydrolase
MPSFIETHRTTVTPAQCDHLGHMNVQHYVAIVSAGFDTLLGRLGLPPSEIERRRIGMAAVRMEIDYLAEARAGDALVLYSTVEHVGGRSLRIRHRLCRAADAAGAADEQELMRTLAIGVPMDLDRRQGTDLPPDVRAAAEAMAGTTDPAAVGAADPAAAG